jgi:hypothetical protein
MLLLLGLQPAAIAAEGTLPPRLAAAQARSAEFGAGMVVSDQVQQLADWIAATDDHAGAPFIIVDKKRASVLVFDASARLRAHSAVLLGAALGDDSVPGIGTRPMAHILPNERTTPAGRFVAERGRNMQGEDIVWIDYDAAVSMHRVRTGKVTERRAQRLATPTTEDNRISYGCINVPVAFYENFIQPIFAAAKAMVYILPDLKPVAEIFGIPQAVSTDFHVRSAMPAFVQGGDGGFVDPRSSPWK